MKLRMQFLLPIGAAVLVGFSVMGIVSTLIARQALKETADNTIVQVVEALDRSLSLYAEQMKREVRLLSAEAASIEENEMQGHLERRLTSLGYGELLAVADTAGLVVSASESASVGMDIADRDYFRTALQGQTVLSEVVLSKQSGEPVFVAAAPVAANGTIRGVLLLSVPIVSFTSEFVTPIKVGEEGYAYLSDGKGLVIAHPDPTAILDLDLSTYDFGMSIISRKSGQIGYTFRGVEKQVAFRTNPATGWIVAVTANDADIYAAVSRIELISLALSLLLILTVLLLLLLIVRSVVRGIGSAVALAREVASGRLEVSVDEQLLRKKDEVGDMSRAFNRMLLSFREKAEVVEAVSEGNLDQNPGLSSDQDTLGHSLVRMTDSLNELLGQVSASVEQVQAGSQQVSSGSVSLSHGVAEQAGTVEEISSAVTEINGRFTRNAESIREARRLSEEGADIVRQGSGIIEELLKSMTLISEASQSTKQIVKVIDDMSFQINLLSLNANVEAARAGKYGRGFSVVADEVRNLALKSSTAVGETNAKVENVLRQVQGGVDLARKTFEEFENVNKVVLRIDTLLQEIDSASREQTDALNQIDTSMAQIEEVTQSASATAEESASAAEELSALASVLREYVDRFTLRPRTGPSIPAGYLEE